MRWIWHSPGVAGRLIRGASVALLVSAAGQALSFGLQVLFARELGARGYGGYSYLMSWLSIGLIVAKWGYDTALLRFVAAYAAKGLPGRVRGVVQTATRQACAVGFVVSIPLCAAAWLLARTDGTSLTGAIVLTGVLVPTGACSELVAAGVRGLGQTARSLVGDMMIRPIVAAAALFVSIAVGVEIGAREAHGVYLLGTVISLLLSTYFLVQALPWRRELAPRRLRQFWSRSAGLLMVANGFQLLLYSVDVLMLGSLDGMVSSGLYNVASKLAILVIFIMNAAQSVAGPMMAAAYASARHDELNRIVRLFTLVSLVAGLPLAILLGAAAPWVLHAFGPEFEAARGALLVLLAMQCVNVATGPVGMLLAMTGRQRALAKLLAGGLVLNVVLNTVMIPKFGLMGAAWSAFVAHSAWNIAGVLHIRKELGIDCSLVTWVSPPLLRRA